MNVRETLLFGRHYLSASPTPALDARLLLEHVLQRDHPYLVAHDDQELTAAEETHYRTLLERAGRGEPIPYLTGRAFFYGLEFAVSPAVLIPRPETEWLVEAALVWLKPRQGENLRLVDVGTGSGCIAISLAHHTPQTIAVEATELSADALAIGRQNAQRHGLDGRLRFHQGYLLEPTTGSFDLMLANLPYVADDEWTGLDDGVKYYEPALALRGGPDGLDVIRPFLDQAQRRLNPGGAILMEIGWRQGAAAVALAQAAFPAARVELRTDLSGRDRIVVIRGD